MCWGDIQLLKDADGTKYLHFSERQTKTRSRANPRIVQPIKPKAFATPDFLPQQAYKRINCLFDSSDDKASLSLT